MKNIPRIETERLILRPFKLTDAATVKKLAGAREIADTTSNIPHPYEDGMAEGWISTHEPAFKRDEQVSVAITLRSSGELLGAIGLIIDQGYQAELGYWVGKPYWGNGYCSEAAIAMVDYGFTRLKLNRVHARHLKRNPASGRVLEKLGMQYEGTRRQHILKWGKPEDQVDYGLLRSDWIQG